MIAVEKAFKYGAGVLEIFFSVGLGGGDARKRFVQQPDNPLLFGERWKGNQTPREPLRTEARRAGGVEEIIAE